MPRRVVEGISGKLHHAAEIFADDVELEVDYGIDADVVEIGIVEGVGNDAHLELVVGGATYSEADTIDSDATLVDRDISPACHLRVSLIAEAEDIAALLVLDTDAASCGVDMTLNDVAVEPSVHHHGTLHIHLVTHLEKPQITALESLAHSGYSVGIVNNAYNSEAHAVMRHALVYLQLPDKGASEGEMKVVEFLFYGHHAGGFFYYS